MKINRFLSVFIFTITLSVTVCAQSGNKVVYIGSINSGEGSGVYSCVMSNEGVLSDLKREADICEPSYLAMSKDKRFIYTFGKSSDGKNRAYSFKIGPNGRDLISIDSSQVVEHPFCYVSLTNDEKHLLCASYDDGAVVGFGVTKNGKFNKNTTINKHSRITNTPRAHAILQDPRSENVYVTDLGLDMIYVYKVKNKLTIVDSIAVTKGSGPRHIAFSPNGQFMAIANELNHTINIYSLVGDVYNKLIQTIELQPFYSEKTNYGADVVYSPDGRFIYATLRGDCSVVVIEIDEISGRGSVLNWIDDGVNWSRQCAVSGDGKFLVVSNHLGGDVTVYKKEGKGDYLTKIDTFAKVIDASCVIIK